MLYTEEVMARLMKDISPMDQTPEWAALQCVPNHGKIYYGDDVQMVELMKHKVEQGASFGELVDWCSEWADLIVRTQFQQAWC